MPVDNAIMSNRILTEYSSTAEMASITYTDNGIFSLISLPRIAYLESATYVGQQSIVC